MSRKKRGVDDAFLRPDGFETYRIPCADGVFGGRGTPQCHFCGATPDGVSEWLFYKLRYICPECQKEGKR